MRDALNGELRLRAARSAGFTVLTEAFRTAPFHPGPAHHHGRRAEVILQDVGPGVFPGDELSVAITAEAGADLRVVGQGATKLYPCPCSRQAHAEITLTAAEDATLWWLPGALIPFRDADYVATTRVDLAPTARFASLEVISGGRLAMGERDAYRSLDLRLRVVQGGRLRLLERALLDPAAQPRSLLETPGRFTCSGTLVLVGYPTPPQPALQADCWIGCDGNDTLTLARGVATSAERLRGDLLALLQAAETAAEAGTTALALTSH